MRKKAMHSDAVMTGILVTRFKMGQIDVEDLAEMAEDKSRGERCSAAKKVLEAVRDSPNLSRPSRSRLDAKSSVSKGLNEGAGSLKFGFT